MPTIDDMLMAPPGMGPDPEEELRASMGLPPLAAPPPVAPVVPVAAPVAEPAPPMFAGLSAGLGQLVPAIGQVAQAPGALAGSSVEKAQQAATAGMLVDEPSPGRGFANLGALDSEQLMRVQSEMAAKKQADIVQSQQAAEAEGRKLEADQRREQNNRMIIRDAQAKKTQEVTDAATAMTLDPKRGFANLSNGQKFAGVISAMLGGLLSVKRGGPNQGLQVLENIINRDIEAQRANMSQAMQGAQAQRGILADMQATFQDKDAADAAARATYWQGVSRKIETDKATMPPGQQQLDAEMMAREAAGKAEQARAEAADREAEFALKVREQDRKDFDTSTDAKYKMGQLGVQRGELALKKQAAADEKENAKAERAGKAAADATGFDVLNADGRVVGKAKDPKKAEELSGKVAATAALVRDLEDLKRLRADMGRRYIPGVFGDSEAEQLVKNKAAQIIGKVKSAEKLGSLDDGTERYVERLLGKADGFSDPTPMWDQYAADLKLGLDETLRSSGVTLQGPAIGGLKFDAGDTAKAAPVREEAQAERDDRLYRELYGRPRPAAEAKKTTPEEDEANRKRARKELGLP